MKSFLYIALLAESTGLLFSQNATPASVVLAEIAEGQRPVTELHSVRGLFETQEISDDVLSRIVTRHGPALLAGPPNWEKFISVSALCELAAKSGRGDRLVPGLIDLVLRAEAVASGTPPVNDWNHIAMRNAGDRIGLLMGAIIRVGGARGFEQMFNRLEKAGQVNKIKVLLGQLPRIEGARDDIVMFLAGKVRSQESAPVQEAVRAALRANSEDRTP